MKRLVQSLLISFLLASSLSWGAGRVENLYEAEVAVETTESLNSPVIGQALLQVLIKVTGKTDFANFPAVAEAVNDAQSYVREFGYHTIQVATNNEEKQRLGKEFRDQRVMRVAFLRGAVLQLIRRAGLPLWSQNRPEVLLWFAFDDYTQRQWMTASSAIPEVSLLQKMASQRGLPLALPAGDMEDDFALQPSEIFSRDYSRVNIASTRYGSDVIMVAQAVQTSAGLWIGHWRFVLDDQEFIYEVLESTPEDFIQIGINTITNKLADKYAVISSDKNELISMEIRGLTSYQDYAAVNSYLNGLTVIESANIDSLADQLAVFKMQLRGTFDQLDNALRLDNKLILIKDDSLIHTADLRYEWRGTPQ